MNRMTRTNKSLHLFMAIALVAVTASATPAAATQTSQALAICVSRGPDCQVTNKGGGYQICVNNTGGKQCVNCPNLTQKDQTCSVAKRGTSLGVTGILQGRNKAKARN